LFGVNTSAGFHDRCLFGLQPTGFAFDYAGEPPDELSRVCYRNPVAVKIDGSVWKQKSAWNKQDRTLGREVEVSLRAATIAAAYDGRAVLTADHLGPTKAMIDYQKRIRALLKPNEGGTPAGKISVLMRDYFLTRVPAGQGITERDLFDRTNMHRHDPRTAKQILHVWKGNHTLSEQKIGKRTLLIWEHAPLDERG
jgi:hypothetical protein